LLLCSHRDSYRKLKDDLWQAHETAGRGARPNVWRACIEDFRESVQQINKKIDKFNIVAPSLRLQMAHYSAEKAREDIVNQRYPAGQQNTQAAATSSGDNSDASAGCC